MRTKAIIKDNPAIAKETSRHGSENGLPWVTKVRQETGPFLLSVYLAQAEQNFFQPRWVKNFHVT